MDKTGTFRVTFLCTGNRARSAMAENFLTSMMDGAEVEISSAGTLDLESGPALPEAISACSKLGADLGPHRSRPLSQTEVHDLDLIVGFERQHVATAVVDAGAPADRTFLLKELLALLRQVDLPFTGEPGTDARARIAGAHAIRNQRATFSLDEEIADPMGHPAVVFDALAIQLYALCAELMSLLVGRHPSIPDPVRRSLEGSPPAEKTGFLTRFRRR